MTDQETKPDLVLLHGWGVNRCVWQPLTAILAEHFTLHALDLAGYGENKDIPPIYSIDTLADQVCERVPDGAIWLGWSLGGMIALRAACLWPEKMARLILVDTTPRFVTEDDWAYGVSPTILNQFFEHLKLDYHDTLFRFLLLQASAAMSSRSLARKVSKRIGECGEPDPLALEGGLQILRSSDFRSDLEMIEHPTTIIHGEDDRLSPPGAGQYLAEKLPNATFKLVAGGHAPFITDPEDFCKLVIHAAAGEYDVTAGE